MEPQFTINTVPEGMYTRIDSMATLVMLFGVAVIVFWMVCGWRAMRAHERLADAVVRLSRK